MSRTVGRKIRPGERRRFECSYCSGLFDARRLTRDAMGLWRCSCVGNERDAVTLTKGNAEASRNAAQRLRVPAELSGRFQNDQVTALTPAFGNILGEDSTPFTGEDAVYVLGG